MYKIKLNKDTHNLTLKQTRRSIKLFQTGRAGPTPPNDLGYKNHASDSSAARPTGFSAIVWVGSIEPLNAVNGDIWFLI